MEKDDNGGESKPMEEDETEASGAARKDNLFSKHFRKSFGKALEEAWPEVKSTLEPFAAVSCTLDTVEGTMTLSATAKTSSQRFVRAKFVITLLALGIPKDKALKSLSGRPSIFVIGTQEGGLCSQFQIKEKKYKKRLKLLLGSPLEEISKLTRCDVYYYADYIFAAGPVEGLNLTKKIVTDCIVHGIRPTSQIRRIKRMYRVIDDLGALRF